MIIDYYDIWLDEADINEINNTSDDIRIEYYPRKPTPMNAVLDELVPDILLFLNSEEVQAIINSTKLLKSFYSIVKIIKERAKNKEIKKVTAKTCELKEANVIINANNVKILLPVDKTISTTDYLKLALQIPTTSIPKDKELIISFENDIFRVEDLETYGKRKIPFENTKEENDSNYYEMLEQSFISAMLKVDEIKEENAVKKKEEELQEWQAFIGYKDYSNERGIKKAVLSFLNNIAVLFKIMFFSKKKRLEVSATGVLLQSFMSIFFHFIKIILFILALLFIVIIFYHPNLEFSVISRVGCVALSLISFFFSGVFRLMAIEVDQMSDREKIFGLFAAVMSVIPLAETIAGFVRGVI